MKKASFRKLSEKMLLFFPNFYIPQIFTICNHTFNNNTQEVNREKHYQENREHIT